MLIVCCFLKKGFVMILKKRINREKVEIPNDSHELLHSLKVA